MNTKEKIVTLANETFTEIQRAERAFSEAEHKRSATPIRQGAVSEEYRLEALRADRDYKTAKDAVRHTRITFSDDAKRKMARLREEYEAETRQRFAADPSQLDMGSVELLKSGILTADEYGAMMSKALNESNYAMTRLIGQYADQAAKEAEKLYGDVDRRAFAFREVANKGTIDPAREALQVFDTVADVFNRCVDNPAMIDTWDSLTGQLIEML